MHILVELEGVMRSQADEPIATGIIMVGTLTIYNQITFMTSMNKQMSEYWLNANKVVDFDNLIDSSVHLEGEELAHRQITLARAKGNVDLFITSNPKLWVYAFNQGIPSVMFGVPEYIRPEFRPDAPKKIRSWNDIEEAVSAQNALRTKDARLSRTEALNFE